MYREDIFSPFVPSILSEPNPNTHHDRDEGVLVMNDPGALPMNKEYADSGGTGNDRLY